jgi:hypothetical protein
MGLRVGDRVIVLEHWREHGKLGGWSNDEMEHEIIKVNRATVVTIRVKPCGKNIWTLKKDRILRYV